MSDGETVVLLHGAGVDHTVWRYQSRRLAHQGYRIVAPDLPGHGENRQPGLTSISAYADWLEKKLMDLGLAAPATLIGHSMGSLISVDLASRSNRIAGRLVLVGASRQMKVHPQLMGAAETDLARAAALIGGWSLPGSFTGGHPEPGTWHQGAIQHLVRRSRPGVLAGDLGACAEYDCAETASRIEVPTLLISGSEDRMTPARDAMELAGLIPGAEIVLLSGVGHEPMFQQPRRFNRLLEKWLVDGGKPTSR
ncbi:MAG: alpha/beta hydrolase [Acidimicrobiia bacterium]